MQERRRCVGKPGLPLTRLDSDLDAVPDLNFEEWLATTLRENPQVKLAEQASERAEASLVQAKKAVIPDLQVTGILAQNFSPLIENNLSRATGVQGGAQIGVQLPIFNRNQGNVAAARGEIESAKQDLADCSRFQAMPDFGKITLLRVFHLRDVAITLKKGW